MDRAKLDSLFDLTGRVAIVTGGTRGIGLAIAEAYVACGAKVVVASRKPDACAAAEAHLRDQGGDVLGVPTHTGDLDAVAALVDRTVDRFGAIDILVNNAANPLAEPIGQQTPEGFDKSFGVNVRGPVFLIQAALPHLEASPHAAVLNVVTVGVFQFADFISIYAAGKAALLSYTRSMAANFVPRGIRINALAPGTVNTDMVRNNTDEIQQYLTNSSLMRRMADPDEMVGPALLLTSDAGSFITGQVLLADGGFVAH
jgi:NAD(P)-dependent dehydrogenase (short-subunit alcohol dehydrogenase family)